MSTQSWRRNRLAEVANAKSQQNLKKNRHENTLNSAAEMVYFQRSRLALREMSTSKRLPASAQPCL